MTAEQLAQIRQSVLLIWGERDAFGAPNVGKKAVRIIPDAKFHIIPEGGHIPWVGHSGEVAKVARPFSRKFNVTSDK